MKSYNPFKMWGSYVGAIAALFFARGFGSMSEAGNLDGWVFSLDLIPIYLIISLVGFLIGWGINSLVRALRK
jgi:hypothetical protein